MATVRLHQTTTATPAQFIDGLTDFGGDGFGALCGVGHSTRRGGHVVLGEQLFRLVFEEIHGLTVSVR